jgi:CubicO group peptidase (beta-lactamase class C family)
MVERKMVRLDDPVRKFLPPGAIPPATEGATEITLLDLATQSSGLPRMPSNFRPKDPANPYVDYGPAQLYEFLSAQTLVKKPDAAYLYSNLGVGLLGHTLSLRNGTSYEKMVVDYVATPLAMLGTGVALTGGLKARLAPGHDADGDSAANWDFDALAGCGGLRSTADDMLRYLAAQLNPPAKLAAAIRASHVPRAKTGTPPGSIALAWHIRPDGKTYWHNGGTGGYRSFSSFNPDKNTAIVVLTDTAAPQVDALGDSVLKALAGEPVEPLKIRPAISLDTTILDRYPGEYELGRNVRFTIRRDGNHLTAQLTGQQAFRLFAESESKFFYRAVEAEITFTLNEQGAVTGLTLHQNGRDLPAKRLP